MKRFILLLTGILDLMIIASGYTSVQAQEIEQLKQENEALRAIAAPPPSSLDALFPPQAEAPIFLFRKLGLGTLFSGIVADLFENDLPHAKADFEKFKTQYVEISKLVPEWKKEFAIARVEDLGAALETGDQGKVMAAYEQVGKVCNTCHMINMSKVQQKYHWGDFEAIEIEDPLTNEEVKFSRLKQYIDANFAGISLDVEQGQKENAQKQFQGFNARFQALKETCGACHDTERKSYIDESVQALVDKLGEALRRSSIDPRVVGELSQAIGMESCFKCHLVHVPAASAKFQWAKWEKIKGK